MPAAPGLRPTPDRVRETLFNWIDALLPDASCLDLFAGSGVLGFEAASRGARRVVMVERDPRIAEHLRAQARALGAEQVQVECADAMAWLARATQRFQVVFVDPPYGAVDLPALLARMESAGVLDVQARVFVECPAGARASVLPEHWRSLRERQAGRVRYHLASPPPAGAGPPTDVPESP